jgi:hypothetical protein
MKEDLPLILLILLLMWLASQTGPPDLSLPDNPSIGDYR